MGRITDSQGADSTCQEWRGSGERVVFTNGVFDLLHRGHVEYLEDAAALGDRLVVGVNSDMSARRLDKGADRPFNTAFDRMAVLAALGVVDLVVPFDEDTPLDLILLLHPDVVAKGGDYSEETIVGAGEVKGWGGEVAVIPLREGLSTTDLTARIRGDGPGGND